MKRASKKLISLLLALCMLAGMIPMYAVTTSAVPSCAGSYDELVSAVNAASDGDTIILTARVDFKDTITVTKNLTIKSDDEYILMKRNVGNNNIKIPNESLFDVAGGTLTLEGLTFWDDGGAVPGILVQNGAKLITKNTVFKFFKNNGGNGGAIFVSYGGVFEAYGYNTLSDDNDRTFYHCEAANGPAIFNQGTVTLGSGCVIDGCSSKNGDGTTGNAGAIWNSGTVNIRDGAEINNCTGNLGGAILNYGIIDMSGGTFSGNTASNQGGAIYNLSDNNIGTGSTTITGGFFTGNKANYGGAIARADGTVSIGWTGFQGNIATYQGDDLYTNAYGSNNCGVTFQAYSFNKHQQRGYCVYYDNVTDKPARNRNSNGVKSTTATERNGTNYPQLYGGYVFVPVTLRDDYATIDTNSQSYIEIDFLDNDANNREYHSLSTTVSPYSSESQELQIGFEPQFTPVTHQISTEYADIKVTDKLIYTPKTGSEKYDHRNSDIMEEFYYDARLPISTGETNHSGYATITVTLKANKNHAYNETTVTANATCGKEGTITVKCANCDYVKSVTTIPATGNHSWNDGIVTTPATCVPGVKTYTCTICGATKTETISSSGTGHTESNTYKQVDGTKHAYCCSVCSTWVEQEHSFGAANTYTTSGITVTKTACTKCGYKKVEYSGVTQPTVIVGQASTTSGGTVTLPVRLVNNPGIWAQNFIIYYPENLELTNVSSSTELYPDTDVISNKDITAVNNDRVKSAMLAEGKSPAGIKTLIYYVDNVALEDVITTQGDIVYLTFKVPDSALSEYNIGIIGVDAVNCDCEDISNMVYVDGKITVTNPDNCSHTESTEYQSIGATCVADGYSCVKCNACGNIISSEYTKATGEHDYQEKASGSATCSQKAWKKSVCSVCGDTKIEESGDYAAHSFSNEVVIKQPTALTKGIKRQECQNCDYYKDTEFGVITPAGTSTGDANAYSYVYTENIVAGGEYVITNYKKDGEVVSMSADAASTSIVNGAVTVSGNTVVEETVQDNEIWTATSDGLLVNKATGQYLKAFENGENKKTHLNVGLASDPFTNSDQFFFNNGVYNKNNFGYYLGWANYVTESLETARPSNNYLKASSWLAFQSDPDASHKKVYLDTNFEFEFDATFGSANAKLRMFRPIERIGSSCGGYYNDKNNKTDADYSWNKFCIEITPTTIMIAGADFENQQTYEPRTGWEERYGSVTGSYSSGNTFDFTQWNHYKITVDGTYVRAYVNGTLVVTASLPSNFGIAQTSSDYNCEYSRGLVLLNYDWWPAQTAQSMDEWNVGIDNMKIVTRNNGYTHDSDNNLVSTIGGSEEFTFFWDFEDEDGDNNISGIDNYLTAGSATVKDNTVNVDDGYVLGDVVVFAEQKFIASGDSSNKVYFFKKTSNDRAAEIYERVNAIEPGAEYVIVNDNLEGGNKIVKRDGSLADVTVYSDAISFDPYVSLADGGQYSFVLVGSDADGYLINSCDNNNKKYLKADGGVTTSPTSENIIKIQSNINGNKYFEISGTRYYLYKKTEVIVIDTDLVNDISVVDFGWSFRLSGEKLRGNDSWVASWEGEEDSTVMKLSSLVGNIPDGIQKNNYFYKTSKISGSNAISFDGAEVKLQNNDIIYSPVGKYEDEKSFGYEFLVDHIASYIYGEVNVIPATTVYYEETFITFKDATASGSGEAAKWTKVGSGDSLNDLFIFDSDYGYASEYSNYSTFSAESAMKTTITAAQAEGFKTGYNPTAEFTFKGTGFEVFAATSGATGTILVTIENMNTNEKSYLFVDTYYGSGSPNGDSIEKLSIGQYQVPVIKRTGLGHGTYKVIITTLYDAKVDNAGLGYSEFYIDGVRVFDPLGTNLSETAEATYKADREYAPKVIALRDQLTSGDSNKALYIDGRTIDGTTDAEIQEYKTYGANNEVQLGKMGAVAFNLKASGETTPAKVSIGIKLASGSSGKVTVAGNDNEQIIEIHSATDMYYEITDVYKSGGTVLITNSSENDDVIISLTTLKYSYSEDPGSTSSLALYSNSRTIKNANRMMRAVYNIEDETFTVGDINGDGKINAMDMLTIKRYLSGYIELSETELKAADINGDGRVDSRDILALRAMM